MSTRALIAREVARSRYVGRYHHHDGEPSRLGKAIWQLYHGRRGFTLAGKLERLQSALLDAHPAGWFSILGEWGLASRFKGEEHPECLCHGRFREPARELTERTAVAASCEFGYVLTRNPSGDPLLRILAIASPWETAPNWSVIRRRSIPAPAVVADVMLHGPEPDWHTLTHLADAAREGLDRQARSASRGR